MSQARSVGYLVQMPCEDFAALIAERLAENAASLARDWSRPGAVTRHCVLDDLLPEEMTREIYTAFVGQTDGFIAYDDFRERERVSRSPEHLPSIVRDVVFALQDERVIQAAERITGMRSLEPDPQLYAGGVGMMHRGDFLNPHVDNSHDCDRQRFRRLNLLFYFSPGWRVEHGGNLELWDQGVREAVTIPALFNRLVLMETTPMSWHSISPVVARGPRCAIRGFYFSQRPPPGGGRYHVTSFTGRPDQKLRRAVAMVDNPLRTLARNLGLKRHAAIKPRDTSAA